MRELGDGEYRTKTWQIFTAKMNIVLVIPRQSLTGNERDCGEIFIKWSGMQGRILKKAGALSDNAEPAGRLDRPGTTILQIRGPDV